MIVGLTGGIASGKTTVSNLFKDKGCSIVDADQVARDVVEPGQQGLQLVVNRFGREVLAEDGTLNRSALGQLIFDDSEARADLNAILHPLIRLKMEEEKEAALKKNPPFVIMDIPLLYENMHDIKMDTIIVVYVPVELQLERLMQRNGLSLEEAQKRIASQMDIEEKKRRGDLCIDNSGSPEETVLQVEKIYSKLSEN